MDCRQIEELMMDYLYQELDADQMSAYRAHLPTCATCAAMLAGYERTRQAVRALPELEPPESVTSRLLAEAARRPVVAAAASVGGVAAAAAPVEGKSAWGWLTGWMQPIFAHPGFAAAASVVIVAGIAGILTLKGKMDLSESPRVAAPMREESPAMAPAPVPTPTAASEAPAAAQAAAAPSAAPPSVGYMAAPDGAQPEAAAEKKAVGTVHLAKPQDRADVGLYDSARDESKDNKRAAAPALKLDEPAQEARGRVVAPEAPKASVAAKKPSTAAPAKALRETEDDAESGVEGGVIGGETAGVMPSPAPAAPPPPPAPSSTASVDSAGSAGGGAKGKAADDAQLAEAKKLHGQARSKANTGDCAEALRLRDRIYRVDPAYFERSVKNDADLGKCTVARKKAAPASKAPAPAESAPAADEKAAH